MQNRFCKMKEDRLPRQVLEWDLQTATNAWASETKLVLVYAGISPDHYMEDQTDLEVLGKNLHKLDQNHWKLESFSKPKLQTFVQIHTFEDTRVLLKANLSRLQHSLAMKFKSGVLPIQLEVGRYKGTKEKDRLCQVCE